MGNFVCLLVHLQIHESSTQSRRVGIPYGVRYMFIAHGIFMNARLFPCSLEEALMLKEPNNILTQILVQFIVNLKPQTRNLRYSRV